MARINQSVQVGMRFGMLTVLKRIPNSGGKVLCQCDCGKTSTPQVSFLPRGRVKSCGCQNKGKKVSKTGNSYDQLVKGKEFSRLTIVCRLPNRGKRAVTLCSCSCGKEVEILADGLLNGCTQSCGCLARERVIQRNQETAKWKSFSTRNPRTYRTWQSMRTRCYNKNQGSYREYGAAGVVMCEFLRKSPKNLVEVVGFKPKKRNLSIDRFPIHDGNYTCGQCKECKRKGWKLNIRWATRKDQAENRGDFNIHLTAFGKTQLLSHWEKETGIDARRIMTRIRREKWSVEKALSTPTK